MPEDPGGQTSTLKATKSAPLGPPSRGSSPHPPPGLGVIKHDRGRGSSPSATPSLRAPSSPGWGSHTPGFPDARGSQEIQGGPPPQSTFRKGHLLRSPSSPRGNLGPPRCGRPMSVALSGRCHSASWFQDPSVFHSLLSVAESTPLCERTTHSLPKCLPTLGGLTVWLQQIRLL